jgi:hypothetical protein
MLGERVWQSAVKASCVRNPWDRVVSMFATGWWHRDNLIGVETDFATFIRNLQPHPHERYDTIHCNEILNEKLDIILRFEDLERGFKDLCSRISVHPMTLPHTQKRDRKHYSQYYTDETINIVANIFSTDISLYGYEFDNKHSYNEYEMRALENKIARTLSKK